MKREAKQIQEFKEIELKMISELLMGFTERERETVGLDSDLLGYLC